MLILVMFMFALGVICLGLWGVEQFNRRRRFYHGPSNIQGAFVLSNGYRCVEMLTRFRFIRRFAVFAPKSANPDTFVHERIPVEGDEHPDGHVRCEYYDNRWFLSVIYSVSLNPQTNNNQYQAEAGKLEPYKNERGVVRTSALEPVKSEHNVRKIDVGSS